MPRTIPVGNPPIDVTLRKSAKARRMTLRVSRLDGRVTLSIPQSVRESAAANFARSREAWLRQALSDVSQPIRVGHGTMLLIEGREIRVVGTPDGRGAVCDGVTLTVNQARSGPAAKAFLTNLARDRLTAASDKYAERIGHRFRAITLRDTRSRWGSCTAERRLMYSWRLAMAPADVLDYVAAHEVAHLEHMDHSADFWRAVAQLCPNYESHRTWLRENGPSLHRFVFTD